MRSESESVGIDPRVLEEEQRNDELTRLLADITMDVAAIRDPERMKVICAWWVEELAWIKRQWDL